MKRLFPLLFCVLLSIVFYTFITHQKSNSINTLTSRQQSAIFTTNLSDNSKGEQVAILQSLLKTNTSLYTGPVSGFYTLGTKDAVMRFQNKYLIPPTGNVDLPTRLKLNEVFSDDSSKDIILQLRNQRKKWGMADKVEGTRYGWSMLIENDLVMGSAIEIFHALNSYREEKGSEKLQLSHTLTQFAEMRAKTLDINGGVDEHVGFKEYIRSSENRRVLGYSRYGENTSCGYKMTANHMIRWIFAGDAPHDLNQLATRWKYVGVGVSGTCVSLIFAH